MVEWYVNVCYYSWNNGWWASSNERARLDCTQEDFGMGRFEYIQDGCGGQQQSQVISILEALSSDDLHVLQHWWFPIILNYRDGIRKCIHCLCLAWYFSDWNEKLIVLKMRTFPLNGETWIYFHGRQVVWISTLQKLWVPIISEILRACLASNF